MKIFLSYGHDSNAPLIEKIKEYLSKYARAFPQVPLGTAGLRCLLPARYPGLRSFQSIWFQVQV